MRRVRTQRTNQPPAKPEQTRTALLACAVLALLVLVAYSRVLWPGLGFVSLDDPIYVTQNPHVHAGLSAESTHWAFTATRSANWHPLTWLSHQLDWQVWSSRPFGHHLSALLLHLANTLLLFLVLLRLTKQVWQCAFVAALFGLHPLHVESVAWVAERKDVLSTFFWFLTIGAYALYVEKPGFARYALVALTFALGLMAKPMLVSLPFVLMLLDIWPIRRIEAGRRSLGRLVAGKGMPLLLTAASGVITFWVQQQGGAVRTVDQYPLGERLANAVVSCVTYVWKMLWPSRLSVIYPHPGGEIPVWTTVACTLALIAATYGAIRSLRSRPYVFVGWFWYLVTLVPVIGLVQVGNQAMADRYTYIPLVGLFIVIAWGVPELLKGRAKQALAPAAAAALAALVVLTWFRVGVWKDGVTLFTNAVAATSGHEMAHYSLADALNDANKPDAAIAEFRAALRKDPKLAPAWSGIGFVLFKKGNTDGARRAFRAALKIDPGFASAHANLGQIDLQEGRLDAAESRFRQALRLQPNNAEAQYNFGALLFRKGDNDAAMKRFRAALRLDPDLGPAHYNLAVALYQTECFDEAWQELQKAKRLGTPGDPAFERALSQMRTYP